MTESHENENTNPLAAGETDSQVSVAANLRAHHRKVLAGFFVSLAFTLFLVKLKMWAEPTVIGQQIEETSYGLLQHHLGAPAADTLRVVVLDISAIPMRPADSLEPPSVAGLVTDRTNLSDIVSSLDTDDDKPMAIGLDIDFSPTAHGFADSADRGLFENFLNLQSKRDVPIRVGVNNSISLGPDKWLFDPKYLPLATCIVVPNAEKGQSTRYVLEDIQVDYRTPLTAYATGESGHCPAMGFALVKASVPDVPWWAKPFAETVVQESKDRLSENKFLVDYSPLDLLSASPPEIKPDTDMSKFRKDNNLTLANKVVLLGRTRNTTDTFTVSGKPEKPYAGVFLHACAAYTLLERPLYRLKEPGRFLLDFVLSAAIFGFVLGVRWQPHGPHVDEFLEHRLPQLLALFVAIALIFIELLLVPRTHLMWDDFLLVAGVLLVHAPIEHTAGKGTAQLVGWVRSLRDALVSVTHRHSEGE